MSQSDLDAESAIGKAPFRIAAVYFVVGALWILITDHALFLMTLSPQQLSLLQTVKGSVYVLITAFLAWVLVRRYAYGQMRIQRKLREQRDTLEATLREREALIGEIHHRVKNILQIVLSIIRLSSPAYHPDTPASTGAQADKASNTASPAGSHEIERISERVRTIALVHDHVLISRTGEEVDCSRYIPALVESVRTRFFQPHVTVTHRIAALRLALDVAVPCGLVINELLINALTHAFPPEREGAVCITLDADADNSEQVMIAVRDDGVGLAPTAVAPETTAADTVGLLIAEAMASQISGDLEIGTSDDSPGTEAVLRFPRAASVPREPG